MDPITNKLAAYIIDSGKHAEFSSMYCSGDDGFSIEQEGEFNYVVHADALTFSAGIAISEEQGVELMVSFTAGHENKNFSSGLIQPSSESRSLFCSTTRSLPKTSAELFRETYRGIFGFDCITYAATTFLRRELSKSTDYTARRLRELLTEKISDDSEINSALYAAGFMFVALRNVISGEPQPVFWANGHYTKNATDEDQTTLEKIIVVCNSHLQTRYLNSLFSRARGFCPHLTA